MRFVVGGAKRATGPDPCNRLWGHTRPGNVKTGSNWITMMFTFQARVFFSLKQPSQQQRSVAWEVQLLRYCV